MQLKPTAWIKPLGLRKSLFFRIPPRQRYGINDLFQIPDRKVSCLLVSAPRG
jgi:hypothetical protein